MSGPAAKIERRIGIVGGVGWLGRAIASGAIDAGVVDPGRLILSGRSQIADGADLPGVQRTTDNDALVAGADVVVLSVRPEHFGGVRIDARGRLVISVMAGIPVRTIAERSGAREIVRAIPNAAAEIRQSFTPWYATPEVTPANRALVQALFDACGEGAEVPLEAHVDYCVGLTGSGAAFPALLAREMTLHAIEQGLPADFARRAARGVVAGASRLLTTGDPAEIVRTMLDYRGTTAAALQAMLHGGFAEAVASGLDAASAKGATLAAPADIGSEG